MADTADAIVVSELRAANDRLIGHVHLQSEPTLNALTLAMVRGMEVALAGWRDREDVVAVLITGAGDRAFCAGGDIQALYRAIVANHAAGEVVDPYPFEFFEEEYRLDYQLHTFAKPVITVGHGVVMGGGLGILSASDFRVLTEKSRLALPEITIGLFPDAGGTWTLRNTPAHWASFLGLTGSHVNAADALAAGWASHVVAHDQREELGKSLAGLAWQDDADANRALIADWLTALPQPPMPGGELAAVPERQVHVEEFARELAATRALSGRSAWIDKGLANLEAGCPTTAGIVVEQLRRSPTMDLAECYRMELTVGTHCAQNADFREGVRALLIDKDLAPRWRDAYDTLDWDHVLSHFEPPWDVHPLADLGGAGQSSG